MGDDDEGRALGACQLQHQFENAIGRAAIQVASGLIGQHAGRSRDQGACDGHALALAAGELGRAVQQTRLQSDTTQHVSRDLARLRRRHAPNPQRHGNVVLRAELGQQMVELVNKTQVLVAQAPLCRSVLLRQVLPLQADRATGRCVEPTEQMQQRAFSGTRCADDGQRLAGMHIEVNALQHGDIEPAFGETLGQATRTQDDFAAGLRVINRKNRCHLTHNAAPLPD